MTLVARADRVTLIQALQAARGGRPVIAYVTSTRPNLEVPMRMDVIPIVHRHLRRLRGDEKLPELDLFIHTNGGESVVPWRLVALLREFAKRVNLLVPHRAYSAGTLTALGADEVVMHPMGTLGPIDPTVANKFNPPDPQNPAMPLGISVEDVTAYISLVREDVHITHEDELVQAFMALTKEVHPLALGNVKRQSAQSRMMAEKLLRRDNLEMHAMSEIIDRLGSKLYFHGHPINRREAREDLGLTFVKDASPTEEVAMWALYEAYREDMKLDDEWQPIQEALAATPLALPAPPTPTPAGLVPGPPTVSETRLAPNNTVRVESELASDVRTVQWEVVVTKQWNGKQENMLTVIEDRWKEEA